MSKSYRAIPVQMGKWITALNNFDSHRPRNPAGYHELYKISEPWRNVLTCEDKRVGAEVLSQQDYTSAMIVSQAVVEQYFIRVGCW